MSFRPVSGRGKVSTFTIVRYPAAPEFALPYVLVMVELDEQVGLRMIARYDPTDFDRNGTPSIGMPIELGVEDGPLGRAPVARPTSGVPQ